METLKFAIKEKLYAKPQISIFPENIDFATCLFLGVNQKKIYLKTRKKPIKEAKHIAMALRMILLNQGQASCGQNFGGMDHSSCHHAKEKFFDNYSIYPDYREQIRNILEVMGITRQYFDNLL